MLALEQVDLYRPIHESFDSAQDEEKFMPSEDEARADKSLPVQ